ncbi:MAG TPA: hypothetical protein VGR45_06710 [Stellaceae bacterium]|nr:hypothetical protein [Stellaceae bacterium]
MSIDENGSGNGKVPDGAQPEAIGFAVRTLRGDLRDRLLELVRHLPKQWHALTEKEQRDTAFHIDEAVQDALTEACRIVHAQEWPSARAKLGDVKIGEKGIEGKILLGRYDPQRYDLFDAQGAMVTVIVDNPHLFMGERSAAKVDPQEPPPPLETLEVDPDAPQPDPPQEETGLSPRENGRQAALHGSGEAERQASQPKRDLTPYDLGQAAFKAGAEASANPFPIGGAENEAWREGWTAAFSAQRETKNGGTPDSDEMTPYELGAEHYRHGGAFDDPHFGDEAKDAEWRSGYRDAQGEGADDIPAQPKRGRGRPRKNGADGPAEVQP